MSSGVSKFDQSVYNRSTDAYRGGVSGARHDHQTLRFYEDSGLLPPAEGASSGYRDYAGETIRRLKFIRRGRAAGLTLAQISDILSIHDHGSAPAPITENLLVGQLADLDTQIAGTDRPPRSRRKLHDIAVGGDSRDCEPGQICSYL